MKLFGFDADLTAKSEKSGLMKNPENIMEFMRKSYALATRIILINRPSNRCFYRWNNPAVYRFATCHNLHMSDRAYLDLTPSAHCRKIYSKLHVSHALCGGSCDVQSQPWHCLIRICYPWLTPLTIPARRL